MHPLHPLGNRTTLDACAMINEEDLRRDLRASYQSIWGTLAHIYQADCVWWNRFQGEATVPLSLFEPGTSLGELRERWLRVLHDLVAWAETRTEVEWAADFEYRNSRGDYYRQPVWEAALHVVNHATLHRGQILSMFRQLDRVPTGVDLIFYYREKAKAAAEVAKR
ncbi:MAG: DinB family protein [Bryobacterales bacterium]|nr:DinB family protein [Bryobacterales bacterium]